MDAISRYVVQENPHNAAGAPYSTSIAQPEGIVTESSRSNAIADQKYTQMTFEFV
eukprot:m.263738 g.263738  ORF g.263738 m.263738 type:complete len:55 (-) comp19708_c0_seq39:1085-1249(-)